MRHFTLLVALAFGLSKLLCASNVNAQQQIRFRDDKGQPVKNVEVKIDCGKNKVEGYTDGGGTFSWQPMPPFPSCVVSAISAQTEVFGEILNIPPSGVVDITYVLSRKRVWVVQVTVIDEEKKSPVAGVEVKFECGGG